MTHDQFITKYSGKKIDWDGKYQGQCVDLFRQYCHDVFGMKKQPRGVYGAADFWENFELDPVLKLHFFRIPNTLDFIPKKGDVMVWKRSAGKGYGHISIVHSANVWTFISFDQNWRKLNVSELTKHNYLYPGVYGVLRKKLPKDLV